MIAAGANDLDACKKREGAVRIALPGCGHVPTYDDPALVALIILEGSDVDVGGRR